MSELCISIDWNEEMRHIVMGNIPSYYRYRYRSTFYMLQFDLLIIDILYITLTL